MARKLHFVTIADDNGWLDGCNDYWGTFFGGFERETLVHTSKRAAKRARHKLHCRFDDDGQGKPTYGIVTIEATDGLTADDVRALTGYRGGFDSDDLAYLLHG